MYERVANHRNTEKGKKKKECKLSKMSAKPGFLSWPHLNDVHHGHNLCFSRSVPGLAARFPRYITDTRFTETEPQCSPAVALQWITPQVSDTLRGFSAASVRKILSNMLQKLHSPVSSGWRGNLTQNARPERPAHPS